MIFEPVRTGLVLVFRLNTILGFPYRALTQPSLHTFKIRLENEYRVGTPIGCNLKSTLGGKHWSSQFEPSLESNLRQKKLMHFVSLFTSFNFFSQKKICHILFKPSCASPPCSIKTKIEKTILDKRLEHL